MVMGGVRDIRNFLKKMPYTVRVGNIPGGMSEFINIQDAIDYCDNETGDWTIEIYTGTYVEGDLTSTGAANITLRGMGDNRVQIALGAAPALAMVVVTAGTMTLENLEISAFDANQPPLRVTGGVCRLVNCLLNGFAPPGNSIEQVGGTIHMDRCEVSEGTIDLRDAACTINIHNCNLTSSGDIIETADGAGANIVATVLMNHTDCGGGTFTLAATGACVYFFEFCTGMANIADASLLGTSTMRECQVAGTGLLVTGTSAWTLLGGRCASVSNTDGTAVATIDIIGGIVQAFGRAQGSIVWWQDENTFKVLPCTTVTDAIIGWAVAAAGAGDVILIHSGTYEEAVTLAAGINLKGVDKELCIIDIDHATLITMAEGCAVSNLTLNVTSDATGSGYGVECNDANCSIEDCNFILNRTAGVMAVGISELTSNTARTVYVRNVRMRSTVDTNNFCIYSDQANKTWYIENSWCQGGDYGLRIEAASTVHSTDNHWETLTYLNAIAIDGATVRLHNDVILGTIARTSGIITYKDANQEYEVWAGMLIQDAITAAAAETTAPAATAPYTILIHPGIYDEAITCSSWVNLKGVGPKGSVVIYQDDTSIVTLANNIELQNFTVRLGTPSGNRVHMQDGGAIATFARFSELVFEITTPGVHVYYVVRLQGTGTVIIERCYYNIAGTGASYGLRQDTNVGTMILTENDLTFINANAYHILGNSATGWTAKGNRFAGTCAMFNVTAGTFTFDNDAILCTAAWTNTGTTMTLRNCAIEAPVVAGNLATVRMKNCSYRAISRAGTGNIVDESPGLKDAPWKVHKWNWMTALANMDVGTRGTPVDAGSGQILLEVNTGGAVDAEAVEANPEAAGSLSNEFTPARTPRFLGQIAVDNFHADADMFFGLRETLGALVPAATEHHAGFIWNGANFIASSDDGVATQTTNLTTPTVNVQVQLELIVFGGVTTVGWVEFYIDGVLVATHATRIPVNGLDEQHLLNNGAGGGAAADIDVTVRNGGCQACPA